MPKYTQLLICSIILCTCSLSAQLKERVASLTRNLGNLKKIIAELPSETGTKSPPENGKPSGGPPPPPPPGGKGPGAKPTIDNDKAADIIRKAKDDGEIPDVSIDEIGKYLRKNYTVPQKQVTEIWKLATATKPSTGTGTEAGGETGGEGPKPGTGTGTKPATGTGGGIRIPTGNATVSEEQALDFAKNAINEGKVAPNVQAVVNYLETNNQFPGRVQNLPSLSLFESKIRKLLPATTKPTTGSQKGTAAVAIAAIEAEFKRTGKKFKNMFAVSNFLDANKLRPTTLPEQKILDDWLSAQGY